MRINEIVALWCNVEPSQFSHEDALISGELEYLDDGLPYGNGQIWYEANPQELIQKNKLRINKEVLKEWFIVKYEQGQLEEIPIFLDKEKQQAQLLETNRSDEPLPIEDKVMATRNRNNALKIIYASLIKSGWTNYLPTSNQVRGNANTEIDLLLNELELTYTYDR